MAKISKKYADKAVGFIESLTHVKGEYAGKPLILEPWQKKIVRGIFGQVDKQGNRVIRTAYVELARKNGKSLLSAAIALKLLFADGEMGAEIYSAAGDRDQANLVFNVAAMMVRQSPELSSMAKIIDSQKRIVVAKTGSFYRSISAEAGTKHGFDAHGIIFDELHTQPNRELWDVLETSKGARRQPLMVAITTAGFDKHSICYEQHDYAQRILDGSVVDPSFYPVIYGASQDDDWTDEKVWHKANPALKTFRKIDEMRQACQRAKDIPAFENTFRRLYLNQWTEQETRWLQMSVWDECGEPFDAATLKGRRCYGGLDLASTTDVAAFSLVFPPDSASDIFYVLCFFWIPGENVTKRSSADRAQYDLWSKQGHIQATPGNIIDYKYIYQTIDDLARVYDIEEIAFDRWGSTKFVQELSDRGMTVVEFGQGFASMSAPTKELMMLLLSKKIRHGGNPVLRWMAGNAVTRQDPAGNIKIDKQRSSEKVDGLVALVMALDRAIKHNIQRRPVPAPFFI